MKIKNVTDCDLELRFGTNTGSVPREKHVLKIGEEKDFVIHELMIIDVEVKC